MILEFQEPILANNVSAISLAIPDSYPHRLSFF